MVTHISPHLRKQILLLTEAVIFQKLSSWLQVEQCIYCVSLSLWWDPISSESIYVLVCCCSRCGFMNTFILLCLKDTIALESSILSGSYDLLAFSFTQIPDPQRQRFEEDILFWTESCSLLLSAHCPVKDLCVISNLLQEASLLMTEGGPYI